LSGSTRNSEFPEPSIGLTPLAAAAVRIEWLGALPVSSFDAMQSASVNQSGRSAEVQSDRRHVAGLALAMICGA
jgi:hypothetical protein